MSPPRAVDKSWHHHASDDWWDCILSSATLKERVVVIKRYDCTHGCLILIYTVWNSCGFSFFFNKILLSNFYIDGGGVGCKYPSYCACSSVTDCYSRSDFGVCLNSAVIPLTEACTWTSPIPPSVPSMGCPLTAQGHCTRLTCLLRMNLSWGRLLLAR